MSDVVVHGPLAFVGVQSNVLVYDASNPLDPELTGTYEDVTGSLVRAWRIQADDTHVYVAGEDLWVLDVTDPGRPRLAGRSSLAVGAVDLALAGDRIYVADVHGLAVLGVDKAPSLSPRKAGLAVGAAHSMAFESCSVAH